MPASTAATDDLDHGRPCGTRPPREIILGPALILPDAAQVFPDDFLKGPVFRVRHRW